MAKFSTLKSIVSAVWAAPKGNSIPFLILGKPGGGKSALAFDVVKSLGGTPDNTVVFTPSLRDPVDVLGTPRNNGTVTEWVPPAEFFKLRAGVGACYLIIEELTDSSIAMMNAMCRIVLDRCAGDLALSDQLHIIGTGNRTEDKSGANRLTTKLGNRLNVQEFDENLDDWVQWALTDGGIDPVLVQFVRFKPNLLSDFDPNRPYGINPTPRAWEKVARVPTTMAADEYFTCIKGLVGEGAAAEYTGFRKIYDSLISPDEIIMNPTGVRMPTDLSAKYAITGSIAQAVNPSNVERIDQFVKRMDPIFSVMFWNDALRRDPKLKTTKPFLAWVTSNSNVVFN